MGAWDAIGRGMQTGIQAYLEGNRQKAQREQEEKEFKLLQDVKSLEQDEREYGREEKRATEEEKKHKGWAFKDESKNIYIPAFIEYTPGVFMKNENARKQFEDAVKGWDEKVAGERKTEHRYCMAEIALQGSFRDAGKDEKDEELFDDNGKLNYERVFTYGSQIIGMDLHTALTSADGPKYAEMIATNIAAAYGDKYPDAGKQVEDWMRNQYKGVKTSSIIDTETATLEKEAIAKEEAREREVNLRETELVTISGKQYRINTHRIGRNDKVYKKTTLEMMQEAKMMHEGNVPAEEEIPQKIKSEAQWHDRGR